MDRHSRPDSRPTSRPFARFVAIALVVLLTPVMTLAATVAATGTVTVRVHERGPDGVRLTIPMPALVLDAALGLATVVIPADQRAEMRHQIAPYRQSLETLVQELERMPSGVIADIRSDGEHVRITKTWRAFAIDVESDDANVHVAVPARFLSRALDVL